MAAVGLKLYSYWRSSACYRVRIALNLKGLPYEQVNVHLANSEQRGDEFGVLQQTDLTSGAAESLDAVSPRDEHEHRGGRRVAQDRYVERQFLACRSARGWMNVARHG